MTSIITSIQLFTHEWHSFPCPMYCPDIYYTDIYCRDISPPPQSLNLLLSLLSERQQHPRIKGSLRPHTDAQGTAHNYAHRRLSEPRQTKTYNHRGSRKKNNKLLFGHKEQRVFSTTSLSLLLSLPLSLPLRQWTRRTQPCAAASGIRRGSERSVLRNRKRWL